MLALVGLWQLFGYLGFLGGTTAALLALFLAIVLIFVLVAENRARTSEYEAAVAPLYEHHPSVDEGIDVLSISTYSAPPNFHAQSHTSRQLILRVEQRENKVLFFSCIGEVRSVAAWLDPPPSTAGSTTLKYRVLARILTPSMFEVDLKGRAGDLQLLIVQDSVRIATIEWRDAHK